MNAATDTNIGMSDADLTTAQRGDTIRGWTVAHVSDDGHQRHVWFTRYGCMAGPVTVTRP